MKKLVCLVFILICHISYSQWEKVNNGIGDNIIVNSMAYSGGNIFAGTLYKGLYVSTDYGINWTKISSLRDSSVYALAAYGNNIFAGYAFLNNGITGVYRSTNSGASWALVGLNDKSIISLSVYGDTLFAGTNSLFGIYRSTNNGTNWSQTLLNNLDVRSFTKSGNFIFAGTGQDSGVYRSSDNGVNWAHTTLNYRTIVSLASNGNNIFAGAYLLHGVYKSTDNGVTWDSTTLNNHQINSLAINGINIFAGTSNTGVYVSNDNGANWIQRNEGFGVNPTVTAFTIVNNFLFAGTYNGVYKRPLNELIGIQPVSSEVPSGFSLAQNYPNPFNPNTKIKFALPKNSFAKLTIYDMLGRVIGTLVNEQLNAGTYEANWTANNVSSGLYFYRLEAGEFIVTNKMVLIK